MVLAQLPQVGAAVRQQPESSVIAPPQQIPTTPLESDFPTLRIDLPAVAEIRAAQEDSPRQRSTSPLPAAAPPLPFTHARSSPLLQLHSLLSPYSGLIVTLALIASTSLLYWLIVEPAQTSLDYQDGSGQSFGRTSSHMPAGFLVPQLEKLPALETKFPSTQQSGPLDFTKMGDVLPKKPQVAPPELLPLVAERPASDEATSTMRR